MKTFPYFLWVTILSCIVGKAFPQSQVNYIPLFDGDAIAGRTIDTSLPVGKTMGTASVDLSGASTYSVPIYVPPGTNGMEPQISISYSSRVGNGVLGLGWSLTGLSVIHRIGEDWYHDGKAGPVTLQGDPSQGVPTGKFALDGNRLVVQSGIYGANNTVYHTEAETFSRITSKGISGSGPDWFLVEAKNGMTYEYGRTTDSRMNEEGGNTRIFWLLNRVEDVFGNYMEYKYITLGREILLDEILYTGNTNTGLIPYNSVKFNYGTRIDANSGFIQGSEILTSRLLTSIEVFSESNPVKKYYLNYGNDNVRSYLSKIDEEGSSGGVLNSTIFKYGENAPYLERNGSNLVIPAYNDVFSADFNGDGYSDLLAASFIYANGVKTYTEFSVYIHNGLPGVNSFQLTYSHSFDDRQPILSKRQIQSATFRNFEFGDFDGDGRAEFVTAKLTYESSGTYLDEIAIYYPNPAATNFTTDVIIPTGGYNKIHNNLDGSKYLYVGDFNGDGLSDFFTLLSNETGYQAGLSFPGLNSLFNEVNNINHTDWLFSDRIIPMDFDGDGKEELMVVQGSWSNGETEIFTINHNSPSFSAEKINQYQNYPTGDHEVFVGDFNGDGKIDVLTEDYFGVWEVSYSDGKKFRVQVFQPDKPIDINSQNEKIYISDFDGDGKSDILHLLTGEEPNLYLYLSNGSGFHSRNLQPGFEVGLDQILGDFNGDGKSDFVDRLNTVDPANVICFEKFGENLLLHKVSDGFNQITTFSYKRLTENGPTYQAGNQASFPFIDLRLPLYVVSDQEMPDGIGGTHQLSYFYENATLHVQGRGFLGFEKITTTNTASGTTSILETEIDPVFLVPVQTHSEIRKTSDNSLLSETDNTISVINQGNDRYWIRSDIVTTEDHVRDRTETTSFTYDQYGNILTQTSDMAGIEFSSTSNTYAQFGSWIPSSPIQTDVIGARNAATSTSHTYSITRTFNSNGSISSLTSFSGQPKQVVTNFGYDQFGNVISETNSASGLTARTATTTYDSKGRFPLTVSPGSGYAESATFDPRWGKPLSRTSVSGLVSTFQYDEFGRLNSTTGPDGHTSTIALSWDIQPTEHTLVLQTTSTPGTPQTKVWMDEFVRAVKTQAEGFGPQWVQTKQAFDSKGRVAWKSNPHFVGSSSVTTSYAYDFFNQVTSANDGITGQVTYAYQYGPSGQLSVTTTNSATNQTVTTVQDAADRVVSNTDNGGTLLYETNSWGQQTRISLAGTNLAVMQYDQYGMQTQLTDPNAGSTSYSYNAFGELISQTDANGNTVTLFYDNLGRITSKISPEGTSTFEYVDSGNGKGQIKKRTAYSGIIEDYTYNSLGYLSQERVKIGGTTYTTNYGYDSYGNLQDIGYPSGFSVERIFNSKGYLTKVQTGQGAVVMFDASAGSMNALGQYTTYDRGNGLTSQNTFNVLGMPVGYMTPGVQDLAMTWNLHNGNLINRIDYEKTLVETFTYDNLNRLTNSSISGQFPIQTSYQPTGTFTGNFSFKSDAGTYAYHPQKIHAVTSVTDAQNLIPSFQQDISYNSAHDPVTISENGFQLDFVYDAGDNRREATLTNNGNTEYVRYYFGACELNISPSSSTSWVHYIEGGDGLCAIVTIDGINGTNYYYPYQDHLGSILTLTDDQGNIVAEQNFDAWGRKRHPDTWGYSNIPSVPSWLFRGYTGHEHLPEFGLIHMNGRMYDPILGRMLSPDNYVHGSLGTQGFNRYSYAGNNPLKYTDPSGEWIHIAAGALIGGTINLVTNWGSIDNFGEGLAAFGVGAGAGALTAATGGIGYAVIGGALTGGVNNIISQTGNGVGLKDVNWGQVSGGVVFGAVAGGAGFIGGQYGGQLASRLKLSPNGGFATALVGATGGAFGGTINGFGSSLMAGGTLKDGLTGAAIGAVGGFLLGGVIGYGIGAGKNAIYNTYSDYDINVNYGELAAPGRSPWAFSKNWNVPTPESGYEARVFSFQGDNTAPNIKLYVIDETTTKISTPSFKVYGGHSIQSVWDIWTNFQGGPLVEGIQNTYFHSNGNKLSYYLSPRNGHTIAVQPSSGSKVTGLRWHIFNQ